MEPPPFVLAISMYHRRSVKQIRRVLSNMPGVYRVSVHRRSGTVAVHGDMHLDASMLKRRLQDYMGRTVTILSHGGRRRRSRYQDIMPYQAPPPSGYSYSYPYPYPYQYQYPSPAAYPYQQYAPQAAYPYQQYAPPPPPPYLASGHGLPSVFDDTIPGNACTIM